MVSSYFVAVYAVTAPLKLILLEELVCTYLHSILLADHRFTTFLSSGCIEVLVSSFLLLLLLLQKPSSHVPLHVQGEVVGAGEGAFAQVTLEGAVPGVLPEVTCELVRTRKFPAASFPAAVVWFLSWNTAQIEQVIMGYFG